MLTQPELAIGPSIDEVAQKDINRAIDVLTKLGKADVGQSIAVQEGLVLAIEAIEGTDNMIARAGQLKRNVVGPILVKISKPAQERRVDLPTVGLETVRLAISNGFRGLAVEEHGTLLLDLEGVKKIAEANDFFLLSVMVPRV